MLEMDAKYILPWDASDDEKSVSGSNSRRTARKPPRSRRPARRGAPVLGERPT
jgi:hypothetical protein